MKRTNISIFIPHIGCPHRCSFCDQKSISGAAHAPSPQEVTEILDGQAQHLSDRGMTAEIAFFGGSFTAIPRGYMVSLLECARAAVERYPGVYSGIRCSTRPDCISEDITGLLKEYGMTAVELGAQSMCDEVLSANERGHSAEDVRRASRLIRESGISLGLQMMTGLYKDSEDAVRFTCREFIALKPDTVRIYPTVILKGTRLGALYERGEYRSFGFEQTVDLCAELLGEFDRAGIRVIRMGLHASENVERDMLGGVYHPAFREIVESRMFLNDMKERLLPLEKGSYTIFTDRRNISKAVGQKRCNISAMRELGYEVSVMPLDGAYLEVR
ncbi:MAG: radical SAM protein [Oscillospiraceae bacterium]|nr:radical SAM protein [Oscillospiraceae bacterium]